MFEPTARASRVHAFNHDLLSLRFKYKETVVSIPQPLKPFRDRGEAALHNSKQMCRKQLSPS